MSKNSMYIAIDFDGTIVTHEYPEIGKPIPLALETIKELITLGHKVILLTMRGHKHHVKQITDINGVIVGTEPIDTLYEAINYLKENGIDLYDVNNNKTQKFWTSSQKVYANIYIDDAALGCPLVYPEEGRPYVNWVEVRKFLGL